MLRRRRSRGAKAPTSVGNRADWLATDQAVPYSLVRTIEFFYNGRWVNPRDVDEAEPDAYFDATDAI